MTPPLLLRKTLVTALLIDAVDPVWLYGPYVTIDCIIKLLHLPRELSERTCE